MPRRLNLALAIKVETGKVHAEIRQLRQGLKQTGQQADRTSKATGRLGQSIQRVGHYAAGAAAVYLSGKVMIGLVKATIAAADNMALLESRTRLATERTGNFNVVYGELFQLSQQNSVAFAETIGLYQNLARTAPDLGKSTDEILRLTDSVQKLGRISGASQQAQRDSLRQFSQAMAGGVVRAEEFNSIIENTPALANAMAEGMGQLLDSCAWQWWTARY